MPPKKLKLDTTADAGAPVPPLVAKLGNVTNLGAIVDRFKEDPVIVVKLNISLASVCATLCLFIPACG